ncbi:hypothetical protein HMPREF1584_01206, partial [Gardnerella vaginalis JCP8481A]
MKAHCAFNSEQAQRSELLSRAKSQRSSSSSRKIAHWGCKRQNVDISGYRPKVCKK